MPSFLKKKTEAAASEMPPWHPNLRNFARLPDTKVVRTAFFVNGASVFVALGLLLWFAFQEYKLHNLDRQVAEWELQINRDKKESDQYIALYAKFKEEQARINEVEVFVKSRPELSKLLLRLGETLPKDIALDAYDGQASAVILRGTVRGTPDEASGYASAYLDQLRSDPVLNQYFDDYSFVAGSGITRNTNGRLSVQLLLHFKFAAKGAKK